MDIEVARAADRVAAAADAWLRDPRDTGVYGRFIAATEAWRAVARPRLPVTPDDSEAAEHSQGRSPAAIGAVIAALAPTLRQPNLGSADGPRSVPEPAAPDQVVDE